MAVTLKPVEGNPFDTEPSLVPVEGNPFDTTSDLRETVSTVVTNPLIDKDKAEEAKWIRFMNQKGVAANSTNAASLKAKMFGDKDYGAINKELTKQLSVESLGPVKKSAVAIAGKGIMGKLSYNVHRAISGLMTVDSGTFAEKILPTAGPTGMALSWAAKSGGIDVSEEIDKPFTKILEAKRAVADEIRSRGDVSKAIWESGISEKTKQSLPYQAVSGLGEIPMLALYAIPPVGVAVTAGRYFDEGYSESKAAGKTEAESQDIALGYAAIFAPLGVLVDKFTLGIGKGIKPAAGTIGKQILKQTGNVALQSQKAGVGEMVTETAESAYLQKQAKGEINWNQAFTEGSLAYIAGVAGGEVVGTVQIADQVGSIKRVQKLGYTQEEAIGLVDRLSNAKTAEEQQAVSQEISLGVLEKVGKVEKVIDLEVNKPEPKNITGFNGGAMTTDDISVLRQQPELIDNLEQSPQAELLKKAVTEGDASALAEYNQGLVGKPIEEQTTIETPTQEAPQQEEQLAPEVVDGSQIVGISREADNEIRVAQGLEELPEAQVKGQRVTLQEAQDTGAVEKADELVSELLMNPRPVTDVEVGSFIIRKAQLKVERKALILQRNASIESGNQAETERLNNEIKANIILTDNLTKAKTLAVEQNARALAAVGMWIDQDSFDLVDVLDSARTTAGRELTPKEEVALTEEVNKIAAAEESLNKKKTSSDRLQILNERLLLLKEQYANEFRSLRKEKKPVSSDVQEILDEIKTIRAGMSIYDKTADVDQQLRMLSEGKIDEVRLLNKATAKAVKEFQVERAKLYRLKAKLRHNIHQMRRKTAYDKLVDVFDFVRAATLSGDLSYFGRQGGKYLLSHPIKALGIMRHAMTTLFSDSNFYTIAEKIQNDPQNQLRLDSKLQLMDIDGRFEAHQEAMNSVLAEKLPWVRASNRHMITGLNLIRIKMFDDFVKVNPEMSKEGYKAYANVVNIITGRGTLGKFEPAAHGLTAILTAPRWVTSNWQDVVLEKNAWVENQDGTKTLKPEILKAIVTEKARFWTSFSVIGAFMIAAGFKLETDPESPDFLKFVKGDLHIDLTAGRAQVFRLIFLAAETTLARAGIGGLEQKADLTTILKNYASYKAAPAIGGTLQLMTGKNILGQEKEFTDTVTALVTPLILSSAKQHFQDDSDVSSIVTAMALDTIGTGVQVYWPKGIKTTDYGDE